MKKFADLAKLTHRFADTCCYTHLKSKILNKARCGVDLSPPVRRKRKRCPVERNDVRHCPKCKQINDTIWSAHNNTGLWVNDDALQWFETQQDSRRRKQLIYQEYMSRPDAPMIMYSSEGMKFIPPPTIPKKERKNRLDAKNFKRISPEFLRLLQRHHDTVLKNERHEHEPDIETETPTLRQKKKKTGGTPRASYYLRGLKKINLKPAQKITPVPSSQSAHSFTKRTYFKKKRQTNQVRYKAGKDENSSGVTRLKTYTYYPNSSSNKPLRSAGGHISLNRQRGGKEVNYNTSNITSLTASYQLNSTSKAPLRARRELITIIKPKATLEKSLKLNKAGCSKALATNFLCNCTPTLASPSSLWLVEESLPSTSNAMSRVHKPCNRQKKFANLMRPLSKTKPIGQTYDRNRGRHIVSVDKSSIPLTGSYLLATVGDPFETKTTIPSYCQFRDRHLEPFNSERTLKAIDSNMSTPKSSCYLLSTIGDPFDAKTPKHSYCNLGANTRSKKSLTPVYSYSSFAPSTSSVQTQTNCLKEEDNVAKSTQTLLMGQQSSSYSEILSPTSSTLCISDTSKECIIVKPNPSATRRPNHHYPRI